MLTLSAVFLKNAGRSAIQWLPTLTTTSCSSPATPRLGRSRPPATTPRTTGVIHQPRAPPSPDDRSRACTKKTTVLNSRDFPAQRQQVYSTVKFLCTCRVSRIIIGSHSGHPPKPSTAVFSEEAATHQAVTLRVTYTQRQSISRWRHDAGESHALSMTRRLECCLLWLCVFTSPLMTLRLSADTETWSRVFALKFTATKKVHFFWMQVAPPRPHPSAAHLLLPPLQQARLGPRRRSLVRRLTICPPLFSVVSVFRCRRPSSEYADPKPVVTHLFNFPPHTLNAVRTHLQS